MFLRFLTSSSAIAYLAIIAWSICSVPAIANVHERVLYEFSYINGGGYHPLAGLTADRAGMLYGTTADGGLWGYGTVFSLRATPKGYTERILYSFRGGTDGALPGASLFVATTGALFGTTLAGGEVCGIAYCGTAFELTPSGKEYRETIVHRFGAPGDAASPQSGFVADQFGRLYGTTSGGGAFGWGTVYRLTPAGLRYREDILYSFTGGGDGGFPLDTPVLDASGSLYGTTAVGGIASCGFGGCGTVFQLTPSAGEYKQTNLYSFGAVQNDGDGPYAGVLLDASGSLYGTTNYGGSCHAEPSYGCGIAFELAKHGKSYTETIIHRFTGGVDGKFPEADLIADAAGTLFGSTLSGGGGAAGCRVQLNCGTLFEISPSGSGYSEHSIFRFRVPAQGAGFSGNIIRDVSGALYGTTYQGGLNNEGVVFKVIP